MSKSVNQAFERLVKEVTKALKVDAAEGGLVCVFDGFFMYEDEDTGCRGIVAPKVSAPSTFWIATSTGTDWTHLSEPYEGGDATVTIATLDAAHSSARPVSNAPLCDFGWLPPWTEYMEADSLTPGWRTSNSWPLLLDMRFSGGAVGAIPDRFTNSQRSTWKMHGRNHTQRTSTVGAYAVAGSGRVRVGEHEIAYGGGASRWTVVVVSHRQIVADAESMADARIRVGLAHDEALSAVHDAQLKTLQRPQFTKIQEAVPVPTEFVTTADLVVSGLRPPHLLNPQDAAGEVGCNSPRVRVRSGG